MPGKVTTEEKTNGGTFQAVCEDADGGFIYAVCVPKTFFEVVEALEAGADANPNDVMCSPIGEAMCKGKKKAFCCSKKKLTGKVDFEESCDKDLEVAPTCKPLGDAITTTTIITSPTKSGFHSTGCTVKPRGCLACEYCCSHAFGSDKDKVDKCKQNVCDSILIFDECVMRPGACACHRGLWLSCLPCCDLPLTDATRAHHCNPPCPHLQGRHALHRQDLLQHHLGQHDP